MTWRLTFHGHVNELEIALDQQKETLKAGRQEVELRQVNAVADAVRAITDERKSDVTTVTLDASGHADDSFGDVNIKLTLSKGF